MKENIEQEGGDKWQKGLNNLLNSPETIAGLPPVNFKSELTSPALWAEMYAVNSLVEKLIDQAQRFDSLSKEDIYTVEMGADNGVLMAYRNIGDETRTTTIYMSAHGKELKDWGAGLVIPQERVLCHQIKVVSRKQIYPNIFTASQFIYRVSPDFSLIEGDPEKSNELKAAGMLGDGETFFFDSMTREHVMFIEVYDPDTDIKTLAPLVANAKDLWRLLKGSPNDAELNMVDSAIVDMGGKFAIDISKIREIGMKIANDIIAQAQATLKPVPMNAGYLRDLRKNLMGSRPEPIGSEVSIAKTFDGLGLAKKKYLEKSAAKKLGRFI